MRGYNDAGYGGSDCLDNKLKAYNDRCPAGSANPEDGCELKGPRISPYQKSIFSCYSIY
jgi:hypothetical protein